ncbi:PadR family transcriptional regulator [Amycolatopsis endophytica]|uniref:DNA-binding PadR family transcriptional regulator n=1 Tax=Amycolatopsis endophytica TaxID=860233 RepID=A0A853BFI1_9PSEU|nr:PadR family transcriptional regulator [Amycolatopsis endophytica]NYI93432.1 DNA-binding PadR family transcriptional regulator [Amycolatopsis endophytica]
MPRRALDNPLVLAVLGLLLEAPSHPYQMLAELRARSESRAKAINRGTLYDVVEALVAAEWLVPQGVERSGNRPERTVYTLTEVGRRELIRRLDAQIREPRREFTEFLGAVTYLGALGPDGAVDALTARARRLSERIEADEARLSAALDTVPRLHVIEAEYALHIARAELAWIEGLIGEIHAGSLTWPSRKD